MTNQCVCMQARSEALRRSVAAIESLSVELDALNAEKQVQEPLAASA